MRDDWRVVKLGEIAARSRAKNAENLDLVFTVSAIRGLIRQEDYFTKRVASKNLHNYWVVQPGEYVFNKSYSAEAPYGVIAKNVQDEAGVVSPIYIVFRADENKVFPDFLGLALTSPIFWESLRENLKEGGRGHGALNLGIEDFFNSLAPLPPISEQKRIVDLISSVDFYINALKQQLESGNKARNAVLHQLLTAGGDGWTSNNMEEVCIKFGAGPFGSNMKVSTFVEDGIPVISGNHMSELELVEDSFNFISSDHADRLQSSIVQRNDVVITKAGTIGQVSLIPEKSKYTKYVLSSRQLFVRPNIEVVNPKYLAIFLKHGGGQEQILSNVNRTGVPSLSQAVSFIKKVKVELPPLPEQKRIVDLIMTMDSFIDHTDQAIEETNNLRSSLLSDLLSGNHAIPNSYEKVIYAE